jgi:hypothetical protein
MYNKTMESTEQTILTKTTQSGKAVRVVHARYLDSALATVYLDGKKVAVSQRMYDISTMLRKGQTAPAGVTNVIGRVCFTAPEATTIRAALDAQQAEIDKEPRVAEQKLRDKRRSLLDAIRGWEDEAESATNRAWSRGEEAEAFCGAKVITARAEAKTARQALADFDAANPQVIATIERERSEDADRFARTN